MKLIRYVMLLGTALSFSAAAAYNGENKEKLQGERL